MDYLFYLCFAIISMHNKHEEVQITSMDKILIESINHDGRDKDADNCSEARFICPFCGCRTSRLLPFGIESKANMDLHIIGGGRRNVLCPECGSHDRERLVFVYLKYVAKIFVRPDISILHIAPEPRIATIIRRCRNITYRCGDLFAEGYSYPAYVENMDVRHLPFDEGHFDIIICNHVLEHIPDDMRAMDEIHRVLKADGLAILQVPISYKIDRTLEDFSIIDPQERLQHFGQADHCRIYGADYFDRLRRAGFIVEKTNIAGSFPLFALNPEEDLFVCRKEKMP